MNISLLILTLLSGIGTYVILINWKYTYRLLMDLAFLQSIGDMHSYFLKLTYIASIACGLIVINMCAIIIALYEFCLFYENFIK